MATAVQLFSDEYSTYFRDDEHGVLELRWTAATKSMSEQQFRDGLTRLSEFLQREHIPYALIDVVNFMHEPSSDFAAWREAHIIPGYNAAGVKKFAFLLPPSAGATVENGTAPGKEGSANFPTGYFKTRERAYAWLGAQ